MSQTNFLDEIQEINLAYLLLAQRLLDEDREAAMFRLKIDSDVAELIVSLNARQLTKLHEPANYCAGLAKRVPSGFDSLQIIPAIRGWQGFMHHCCWQAMHLSQCHREARSEPEKLGR